MTPEPTPRPPMSTERMLLYLVVFIAVVFLIALAALNRIQDRPNARLDDRIARTRAAELARDPYASFTTVRNDCGACGTNTPVGGWESADGRVIVFEEDGAFTAFFPDESPLSGRWDITGDRLCLQSALNTSSCFDYEQRIDAMKLNEAIYIRE